MEYIGAADYYFWQGVETAQKTPTVKPHEHPGLWFKFNNNVTRDCIEAYRWGLYVGYVLTGEEYIDMITSPKPDIIEEVVKEVIDEPKEILDKKIKVQIEGNC